MRTLWLLPVLILAACGGGSPTSPSVPGGGISPPQTSMIATAPCPSIAPGFSGEIGFLRQLLCDAFETTPTMFVRRWSRPPALYIRTVDEGGNAIDAQTLDTVQSAMQGIAPAFTGGRFGLASVERGTETRAGSSGYITVRWLIETTGPCGASDVATDGGVINFYPRVAGCTCNGTLRARTAKHELGHSFGFYHTDNADDLMSNIGSKPCDQALSDRERQAMAYHYQ